MVTISDGHNLGVIRTPEELNTDLETWLQRTWVNISTASSPTHPFNQRKSWEEYKKRVETQVSDALERMSMNFSVPMQSSVADRQISEPVPVIDEPDQSAASGRVQEMPESNDDFLEVYDRLPGMRGVDLNRVSSPSSDRRSRISDRPMEEEDERCNCVNLFIQRPGCRDMGERIPGILDTGHTAPASLLTETTARNLAWEPDNNPRHEAKGGTVRGINGTSVETLGQMERLTEIMDDNNKTILTVPIVYHVVPDNTFEGDCLLNLKLVTRHPILMLHWLITLPRASFVLPLFPQLRQAASDARMQGRSSAARRYEKARSGQPANQMLSVAYFIYNRAALPADTVPRTETEEIALDSLDD